MSTLHCPKCKSDDVTLPPPELPGNDAVCDSCGLIFGPQAPDSRTDKNAFVAAIPDSLPYFAPASKPAYRALRTAHIAWYGTVLSPPFSTPGKAVSYVLEKAPEHYGSTVSRDMVQNTTYQELAHKIQQ